MESKKLFWVILSLTAVCILVVGAGLILFAPPSSTKDNIVAEADSSKQKKGDEFDIISWSRGNEEFPGLEEDGKEEESRDDVFVVGEYSKEKEKDSEPEKEAETDESTARQSAEAEESAQRSSSQETIQRSQEKTQTDTTPKKTEKTEPKQRPESKPSPTTKPEKRVTVKEYWIQTGSYKSMVRAEKMNDKLKQNGLSGHIFTKSLEGNMYYRVRIGPYNQKGEADKFLGWVKDIKGFGNSYVSIVYKKKLVQ